MRRLRTTAGGFLSVALLLPACARRPHASAVAAARPDRPAAAAVGAGAVPGRVVDKVVAIVMNRPITLSECALEVRIDRARKGDIKAALGEVSESDEAAILPALVDRAAIIRGLKTHYQGTLDASAPAAEARRIRAKFGDEKKWRAFLDKLELSDDEVEERLRRTLEAQSILVAKLRDLIRVGRKDIDAYVARHPGASREAAETAVAFEAASQLKPGILADVRRSTTARIVDPIVAPPEGAGTAVGTTREPGIEEEP